MATTHTRQLTTIHTRQLATIHTRQLATINTRQLATIHTTHNNVASQLCYRDTEQIPWPWSETWRQYVIPTHWNRNLLEKPLGPTARKESSWLVWYPTFHYTLHKSTLLHPILSQMNPIHALTSCSFKVYFNIIFPSTLNSSKMSLSF